MESSAPAATPWVVLAVALVALAVLAVAAARAPRRRPPAADSTPAEPAAAPDRPRWAHDDLPAFLAAPPGSDAEQAPPEPTRRAPAAPPGPGGSAPDPVRPVVAMAGAALLLVAALAGVAGTTRGVAGADDPPPAAEVPAPAPRLPGPPAVAPELPGVPAEPLPGEGGAGALASRSVPLGEEGVAARLTFEGIVLEREAVGVTVAYPSLSVTATGDPVSSALAHVRLDTWNCLTTEVPEDPREAGCVRTRTTHAELPTPGLQVTREEAGLRLSGRFPTYTRPLGGPATYTGRVYDLTVTAAADGPLRNGVAPATGTLFLGTDRARTRDEPGLNVLRVAG